MFRAKRVDTRIDTIERQYGIDLHARGDTLLGNLLVERGFDSLSQLLQAYRGQLTYHPRRRRLFLSFHAEDRARVNGLRLMARSDRVDWKMYDGSVRGAIDSANAHYIRKVIKAKIRQASVLVCLIGNGTAWRDWVDWEVRTAAELRKGICGVRLKGSRGRPPPALQEFGAPVAQWGVEGLTTAIECAAARRS